MQPKSFVRPWAVVFMAAYLLVANACAEKQEPNQPATPAAEAQAGSEAAPPKGQSAVQDDVSAANALQVARSLEDFSTLVTAIEVAGVEDAVVNAGPLTIFAPLNSAFDKLPEGTLDNLVKPENKETLVNILVNHVAPANYPIKTLKKNVEKGRTLYMASGNYLDVAQDGDDIVVSGTKILKSVKVSNGWIHVIDDVLVPPSE